MVFVFFCYKEITALLLISGIEGRSPVLFVENLIQNGFIGA